MIDCLDAGDAGLVDSGQSILGMTMQWFSRVEWTGDSVTESIPKRSGGVALIRAAASLADLKFRDDRQYGVSIIRRAIEEPLRQIATNAGHEGSIVVEKVKNGKGAFGFNAATEEYEDLIKAGVIDPAKVVRAALQNAASVASLMLSTEALITELPKRKSSAAASPVA